MSLCQTTLFSSSASSLLAISPVPTKAHLAILQSRKPRGVALEHDAGRPACTPEDPANTLRVWRSGLGLASVAHGHDVMVVRLYLPWLWLFVSNKED